MKKHFWGIMSLCLFMVNLILIYQRSIFEKRHQELISVYDSEIIGKDSELESYKWHTLIPYTVLGNSVDHNAMLIDLTRDSLSMGSLYKMDGTWVFRFFNKTCMSCVEESVSLIRSFFNANSHIPFIVVTDFNNTSEMRIFQSNLHFDANIYRLKWLFKFSAERDGIPYLAYINDSGVLTKCYTIQKDQIDNLRSLLEIIYKGNVNE